jgi:hypothetical protein
MACWWIAHPAAAQSRRLEARPLPLGQVILVDGELSDEGWRRSDVATDFIQSVPREGAPATNATFVRILYSATHLYIGVDCPQADAPILTTTLARDFAFEDTDTFGITLDPFNDDRNGFTIVTTPDGALRDVEITNDGANTNPNWNAVWEVRTVQRADGWSAEIEIPFKSLRFSRAPGATWGINFSRRVRSKNEVSYWSPVARRYTMTRVSLAGDLVGIQGIEPGRNLKLTPYGVGRAVQRGGDTDPDVDAGVDLKYSVTTSTTLDLTFNTDFSEVEVDTQQVNLTRFPLFFPEKRGFFLENADLFHFGVRPSERGGGPQGEEFIGFFSRRIGLSPQGRPLPLWGGGRLTGRAGPYSLGVLQVSTREEGSQPQNDYTVARIKRNIFGQSDTGGIFMNRNGPDGDFSRVAGADLNVQLRNRVTFTSFLARSSSPGQDGLAGKLYGRYEDGNIEAYAVYVDISDDFDRTMSFIPRLDMRVGRGEVTWRQRPNVFNIREIEWHQSSRYITNQDGDVRTRRHHTGAWVYFHDGSRMEFFRQDEFERLDLPFEIHPGILLPTGDYPFDSWTVQYYHNPSGIISGALVANWGEFWNGTIRAVDARLMVRLRPRFFVEGRYERNDIDLPEGKFQTDLVGFRAHHALSTRQFFDLFIQYNSQQDVFSYQGRYNLIHRPLSDLFVVFQSEKRSGVDRVNAFTVKFTRLFDF